MTTRSTARVRHPRAGRRVRSVIASLSALVVAALIVMPLGQTAHARIDDATPIADAEIGPNTEIQVTALGPGANVQGFQPPSPITQDPLAAYPTSNPAGYSSVRPFSGTIIASSISDPSLTAEMYCINLRVATNVGIGYESGTWEESNVPNIGYVTYILNNYYPTTSEPSGLSANQQAAAVQSAIWYFTDGYVVSTAASSTIREATAAIVAAAQAAGPVVEPPAPEASITPASDSAASISSAGPFTVVAEGATEVTVSVPSGYAMFTDAEGAEPLANPASVPTGTDIWVRSSSGSPGETVLNARAAVTVQRGQVYLYDGNTPSLDDAQRLILADTTELDAVASATAEFFAVGSLTVSKAFAGEALGLQGDIQLAIDCGEGYTYTADIPAGTATTQTFTYSGIPAGTSCTVTEPVTGANTVVDVETDAGQTAEITEGGAAITITNTVTYLPGALRVVKGIAGDAAGAQGAIRLTVVCGDVLNETFEIPAGSAAGDYEQVYSDLPAGTACTVTETETGSTAQVEVATGDPVTVEIQPGATVDAAVANTVTYRPGSLRVVKSIAGVAAGQQAAIELGIVCGEVLDETFEIPAGTAAGEYEQLFTDIPAGTECTVTELESGATAQVDVTSDGPVTVAIEPGATVDAALSNDVSYLPGSLRVVKTVTGGGAGLQDAIELSVRCDDGDVLDETFVIPARSRAGDYEQVYADLPAGTNCVVTETESGSTALVQVATADPVTVEIEPGGTVDAALVNDVRGGEPIVPGHSALPATGGEAPHLALILGLGSMMVGLLVIMGGYRVHRQRSTLTR
ncbi:MULTISPECIES: thioester domain-containing protein [Microbacterium]|nr:MULTISPECIES: thioester domain-containing protein [Microbacterium]RKE63911.1 TQXA domain-containing protein [Microbacterium sp. AG238]WJM16465.1 thioester domain-containing protein [Microbacterium arborescens]